LASAHAADVRIVIVALIVAACGTTGGTVRQAHNRATTGTLVGLARDHDSGDPVALAEIRVRGKNIDNLHTQSNDKGNYEIKSLPPGRYQLLAQFAGQPFEVTNIEIRANEITHVDLVFTLGHPDPIRVDYGDPKQSQIDRYRPTALGQTVSMIEGTVNDLSTRERVPGAVITAVIGGRTEQTVSDDDGRYRFADLQPGTYAISAYYSIGGRGQIEFRRSDISVAAAEAVVVPLWIELSR
jgi:hypothetical protein